MLAGTDAQLKTLLERQGKKMRVDEDEIDMPLRRLQHDAILEMWGEGMCDSPESRSGICWPFSLMSFDPAKESCAWTSTSHCCQMTPA